MGKSGKVAIVTGSATGLALVRDRSGGARLERRHQLHQDKKEADETYETVKAKGVEASWCRPTWAGTPMPEARGQTLKKWGRIDGLVNNAAPPSSRTRATSTA